MAAVPEDVQILFDAQSEQASSEGSSTDASDQTTPANVDWHRQQYPNYVPPHARGHNVQEDDFVNFKNRDPKLGPDPDKVEGVDNDKYQRLKLSVPFALDRKLLPILKSQFPGVYFHARDNGNHDHPFSHVVTMLGTRFLQRRIKAGSRILDAYGNANASDRFNGSQANAANPKSMKALHLRVGPSDFIREVNKWGPYMDEDGEQRYFRGTLKDIVNDGSIREFNVLQFIHTLYYQDFGELAEALHAPCDKPGKRVAYALVHRHSNEESGSINNGEQKYVKRRAVNGLALVKQTNVLTGSEYVHKDLTPLLFQADKTWFAGGSKKGITWECHMVNEETWIIEIVPYELHEMRDDVVDYGALWDLEEEDYLATPPESEVSATGIITHQDYIIIPSQNGIGIKVHIVNKKLHKLLVEASMGKPRTPQSLDEIVKLARHHVNPSALFGDKEGLYCPEDKIFDQAIAAFYTGVDREIAVLEAASVIKPVLAAHASKLRGGPKFRDYSVANFLDALRSAVQVGRQINTVIRHKDPVDKGLELFSTALT